MKVKKGSVVSDGGVEWGWEETILAMANQFEDEGWSRWEQEEEEKEEEEEEEEEVEYGEEKEVEVKEEEDEGWSRREARPFARAGKVHRSGWGA